MDKMVTDLNFYKGKRVLVTGHTGFKGAWMCKVLSMAKAHVTGFSLEPNTEPSLFEALKTDENVDSIIGDIRDYNSLKSVFEKKRPEIIFHLAAQPIVRESYKNPLYTYQTNVMGTVNLLECVRTMPERPKSVVVITTDKVYMNKEWEWGYREYEPLDGFDPYSNSKSCCELAVHSYVNSFFSGEKLAVSTARAGNVIGGGDFAADRIIPDCVRAAYNGRNVEVRNRYSIRPYQHVLEPVFAYLMIAEKQYNDYSYAGYYNIGPDEYDCVSTGKLVGLFCEKWGNDLQWTAAESKGPHEANFLKLDCSKLKKVFGWAPSWNIEKAVEKSVDWYKCYHENMDVDLLTENQIKEFYACLEEKNV